MIGFLRGKVYKKIKDFMLLDVNGVGYKVYGIIRDQITLKEGDEVFLYIHHQQKEDSVDLFGFIEEEDLELFEILISMSGIGPKIANAILNVCDVNSLAAYIKHDDVVGLTKLPGIGKKTAQRMILELKDKLEHINVDLEKVEISENINLDQSYIKDSKDALMFLGYTKKEVDDVVGKIVKRENVNDTDTLIRESLKELGK